MTELIAALKLIKDICTTHLYSENGCDGCPMSTDAECNIILEEPSEWTIIEPTIKVME